MTRQELFDQAYNAFVPQPDDNPDNIPFYRTFNGLRAAWGEEFYKNYNSVIHHCACSVFKNASTQSIYEQALRQLGFYLDHNYSYRLPEEEPRYQGFYDQEPIYPGEVQAKEYFNQQFKGKYPDKRVNCKEAKALWLEYKDKALEILVQEYRKKLELYKHREKYIEDGNRARREEWLDKIHARALFEKAVGDILDTALVK